MLGRGCSEFEGERDNEQDIDPGHANKLYLLLATGNQFYSPRPKNPQRMGLEGDGQARSLAFIGPAGHLRKQQLMTEMHPVKVADGNAGVGKWLNNILDPSVNLHILSSNCSFSVPDTRKS